MLSLYTRLSARFRTEEKGATAVEYGIMVALIAVVIIVAVTFLGGTLTEMFGEASCTLTPAADSWDGEECVAAPAAPAGP